MRAAVLIRCNSGSPHESKSENETKKERKVKYLTDMKRLRDAIDESGISITKLALKADINRVTLYNRFAGIGEFTVSEMEGLTKALHLTKTERDAIFFAPNVDDKSTTEVSA